MPLLQSQKTTDLQAEYASNASDLAILEPQLKALKSQPGLRDAAGRAFLRGKQGEVEEIRARQKELIDDLDAATAEDNSAEKLQKHADAFAEIEKVHACAGEVFTIHALRKDAALQLAVDKIAHRTVSGHKLANIIGDAVSTLAPGDLRAAGSSHHVLPILRGHAGCDAKALACWIRKLIQAAGCETSIRPYYIETGTLYATDRTTFADVAAQNVKEVTDHLSTLLTENGIDPAPAIDPTAKLATLNYTITQGAG